MNISFNLKLYVNCKKYNHKKELENVLNAKYDEKRDLMVVEINNIQVILSDEYHTMGYDVVDIEFEKFGCYYLFHNKDEEEDDDDETEDENEINEFVGFSKKENYLISLFDTPGEYMDTIMKLEKIKFYAKRLKAFDELFYGKIKNRIIMTLKENNAYFNLAKLIN